MQSQGALPRKDALRPGEPHASLSIGDFAEEHRFSCLMKRPAHMEWPMPGLVKRREQL
jgi:hypothetical protein